MPSAIGKSEQSKWGMMAQWLTQLNHLDGLEFVLKEPGGSAVIKGNHRPNATAVRHLKIFNDTDFAQFTYHIGGNPIPQTVNLNFLTYFNRHIA